jgi:hypothetical protein
MRDTVEIINGEFFMGVPEIPVPEIPARNPRVGGYPRRRRKKCAIFTYM